MVVLGIDPGIANVGFGVIKSHSRLSYIVSGTLITNPRMSQVRRIYSITRRIKHIIGATEPDIIVIEDFIPFRTRKNMGHISQAYGAIQYVAEDSEARLIIVRPNIWIRQLLGLTQRAKYSKITTMKYIERNLSVNPKSEHEADALGLALWYLKKRGK